MKMSFQSWVIMAGSLGTVVSPSSWSAQWQRYDNGEDGFTVALPVTPTKREQMVEATDTLLRTYEALFDEDRVYKFTISVGMPRQRGYYDKKSMDAFLNGFPESMVKGLPKGKLESSKSTLFREMPAREFRLSHVQMGQPLVSRGIVFMIDGGYIRISSLTFADDPQGLAVHERFINSFQLRSLAFQPSSTKFSDARGISFTPPNRWLKQSKRDPNEVAAYALMTRWLEVLSPFSATYSCRSYEVELKNSGRLLDTQSIKFPDRTAMRLTTYEMVPADSIKLTSVHYCLDNGRVGAVVFRGTTEDSVFWRYEQLLEGSARTLRIQN